MVRRIGIVLATLALVVGGSATPAAAGPSVLGHWEATDSFDESYMWMVRYSDLWTYSLDYDTSVCGVGLAKIYGPSTNIDSTHFKAKWEISCASSGAFGPYIVYFTVLPGGDLLDSNGTYWHRSAV